MSVPGSFKLLDEFLRIYQIGFVAVWPLIGLASGHTWSGGTAAGLVLISASFNILGGVLNDICDLESDRLSATRHDRWLVTGAVSVTAAGWLVAAQIPIMLAIHVTAGFDRGSLAWLAAAVLGQSVYDVFGKRMTAPPLAETGQGLAAACLVLYGATCTAASASPLAWPAALAGGAMLMLANAFHGGLRDLDDDLDARVRTTPIWLGCEVRFGAIRISPAMSAYSALWLALLLGAALLAASDAPPPTQLMTAAVCIGNIAVFVSLHRLRPPAWDVALRVHLALLVVSVITAFSARITSEALLTLVTAFVAPVLPLTWRRARKLLDRRHHVAAVTAASVTPEPARLDRQF